MTEVEKTQHRYKAARVAFAWVVGLALAVSLALGIVGIVELNAKVSCLNVALSTRNQPATADSSAALLWITEIDAVLTAPRDLTPDQQLAQTTGLIQATATYSATLKADQNYRNAHPLGRC